MDGLDKFSVKIVGSDPDNLQFEITRVDGRVVTVARHNKLSAAQIVALAYERDDRP